MKKKQCEIEGCKAVEARPTFAFCAKHYQMVSWPVQKKLADSHTLGQEHGQGISEAFFKALQEARGDINFVLTGTRTPDETVRDSTGKPLNLNDNVAWTTLDSIELTGRIVAAYWREGLVTVRYFRNGYPCSFKGDGRIFTKIN